MSIDIDSVIQEIESQEGGRIQEILSAAPGGAPEDSLIDESVFGAIRALRERGKSRKAIARELGLDIKTVRKADSSVVGAGSSGSEPVCGAVRGVSAGSGAESTVSVAS